MKRTHAFLIALVLAFAVIAGTVAALRTTQLGTSSAAPKVSTAQLAARSRALDRAQATLLAELKRRPPALPALNTSTSAGAAPAGRALAPQTVLYVRAKPIVHVVHRHGGEHEGHDGGGEAEGGGGNGGGFDD